jgi:flagellar hook-basal body complex protein FliE
MMSFSIQPIAPLSQDIAAQAMTPAPGGPAPISSTGSVNFAQLIGEGMGSLNSEITAAEGALSKLAAGKHVELHELMIGMERARISLQTFVQVRNKLIDSYQDLMRMQL